MPRSGRGNHAAIAVHAASAKIGSLDATPHGLTMVGTPTAFVMQLAFFENLLAVGIKDHKIRIPPDLQAPFASYPKMFAGCSASASTKVASEILPRATPSL